MDFSYDWLLAQIRHDLNKFLLFFIAYFPCFGPNKENPKCRNKLNFIVSTCRSFGCPLYSHIQNVPALVSHDEMEGKRPTNKPKAMEDDDATLSADDFASVVRTMTDTSMSIPKQVFISSYDEATRKNNEMDENANDAMQPLDDEAQHNNNPTQHQSNTTTATKTTSISTQDPPFIPTYNNTMQGNNNLTQQSNDASKWKDDESQKSNNPTQIKSKKTKKTRFTWSHPGTNPQVPATYLIHNANIKDDVFIRHLLNEAPWKAPFGKVTCAWDGLMQKLLSEKHDGANLFGGADVQTLRKRYQQVYLHLGQLWTKEREKHNQEEASEDEEVDSNQLRSTKQRIKQGIEALYEESILHEEEVTAQKTMQQENEENGKLAAIQIRESALGKFITLHVHRNHEIY